jgi:hypothetical protein
MANGEWKVDVFYSAITERINTGFIPAMEASINKLDSWRDAHPASMTPVILLITVHKDLAWTHRGKTTSRGVSEKGNRNFKKHLAIAQRYIDRAGSESALVDPRFLFSKVAVSVGLGTLTATLPGILKDSISYDREYFSVHTKIAPYLMPRWLGKSGVVEIYAASVASLTGGEEMYARVADSIRSYAEESAYRKFSFDGDRVKSGFGEIAKKYPSNFYLLHANIWMACYYEDYELARTLTDKNGYAWNSQARDVWNSFSKYYECKEQANLAAALRRIDLHAQIRKGNYQKFVEIIQGDVDLNAKNDAGTTVLIYAIKSGFYRFSIALVNAGADVETASSAGVRPVHMAASNGSVEILALHTQTRSVG